MARRRLEDLFVRGTFVTIDDGRGEPVTVWLAKLSPVDTDHALRRANAARARVRTLEHDRESDEFLDLWLEVLGFPDEDALIAYLIVEPTLRVQQRTEAETAAEEEWAHEGYLDGLRDAWAGGLDRAYHEAGPDSPEGTEARRVFAELERFARQAAERGADEVRDLRDAYEARDMATLQEEALERIISYRGSAAWLAEYQRSEIFYGTHPAAPRSGQPGEFVAEASTRYWKRREDFDALSGPVLQRLFEEYAALSVDVMEGKGSEETPTSSPSSGSPSAPATGGSSGLVAVAP